MIDVGDGEKRDCHEALQAIYLFLDSEMTGADREVVQAHLDGCLPCLEAYEFEAELKNLIASKCKEEVPEHLYERIRVSLQMELQSTVSSDSPSDSSNFNRANLDGESGIRTD